MKTFLHNDLGQLVSIDFFTAPTVTMTVMFVFIVLEHRRREVLHFNVTEHPTAAWTSQQIVEAFADRDAPRYLIRDRDGVYGNEVRLRIASLHTEEVLTAPQSPWQNPYAEHLIGSIRRDFLNHFVILNARHLKRTLASYFAYYHGSRTLCVARTGSRSAATLFDGDAIVREAIKQKVWQIPGDLIRAVRGRCSKQSRRTAARCAGFRGRGERDSFGEAFRPVHCASDSRSGCTGRKLNR